MEVQHFCQCCTIKESYCKLMDGIKSDTGRRNVELAIVGKTSNGKLTKMGQKIRQEVKASFTYCSEETCKT